MQKPLDGKICLVTGASRGIGKGIALQLGSAGATVYITGRSLKPGTSTTAVQGSLGETADEINARGGVAIPVVCDHKNSKSTLELFEQIRLEQNGNLDLLVNNAFSAANLVMETTGKPFWESGIDLWDEVNEVGLRNVYLCTCEAAKMMVERKKKNPNLSGSAGLIVNISSMGGLIYLANVPYDVGKDAVDRLASDIAVELKPYGITSLSLWPGYVNTEEVLAYDKAHPNWDVNDMQMDRESPEFAGLVVTALMKDSNVHQLTGRVVMTADLAAEYGLKDINGRKISSMRSKFFLSHCGWKRLAEIWPSWLNVPYSFLTLKTARF